MRVELDGGTHISVKDLSLEQWRMFMSEFLGGNSNASSAWDIMGCVRGPDAGHDAMSERPDMTGKAHSTAYAARRKRKFDTVEVLRQAMFFGTMGGAARSHKADHVTVPATGQHDHFDKHVVRAAKALGIKVVQREK